MLLAGDAAAAPAPPGAIGLQRGTGSSAPPAPWNRTFEIQTHKTAPLKTKPAENQGCGYPVIVAFPLYAACWVFRRYQKAAPVIKQQISDAQKQNIEAAA